MFLSHPPSVMRGSSIDADELGNANLQVVDIASSGLFVPPQDIETGSALEPVRKDRGRPWER